MWRPDPRRLLAAAALAALAACGGGSDTESASASSNPAAGIYSGTDSFGNPASVLISPGGTYTSLVFLKTTPTQPFSVSTANGNLTPLVLASGSLFTHDLPSGEALSGSLTVEYTQSTRIRADLQYSVGVRTIIAPYLTGSVSPDIGLPAAGSAQIHVGDAGRAPIRHAGTWSYSLAGGTFELAAGDCRFQGRAVRETGLNAIVLNVTPSPACGAGAVPYAGYAWYDTTRSSGYAVLTKGGSPSAAPPIVITIQR